MNSISIKNDEMDEKEFLYHLFHLKYGQRLYVTDKYIKDCYVRIPGGWTYNNVFIPYLTDTYVKYDEPTGEIINIECPACKKNFKQELYETYQKHDYRCPHCAFAKFTIKKKGVIDWEILMKNFDIGTGRESGLIREMTTNYEVR